MMTKAALGARQAEVLRYIAQHEGQETYGVLVGISGTSENMPLCRRLTRLRALGLLASRTPRDGDWTWHLTDAGWEWLSTRANPMTRPAAPKRPVVGRRMRAVVSYVAKHEGCTKYAAGKAVTRPGRERDGWVIVQRAINAGLISQRLRRDGTTALSVTDKGWVS